MRDWSEAAAKTKWKQLGKRHQKFCRCPLPSWSILRRAALALPGLRPAAGASKAGQCWLQCLLPSDRGPGCSSVHQVGYDGPLLRDLDAVLPAEVGSPTFPLCLDSHPPSSLFWKATSSGSLASPLHSHSLGSKSDSGLE